VIRVIWDRGLTSLAHSLFPVQDNLLLALEKVFTPRWAVDWMKVSAACDLLFSLFFRILFLFAIIFQWLPSRVWRGEGKEWNSNVLYVQGGAVGEPLRKWLGHDSGILRGRYGAGCLWWGGDVS